MFPTELGASETTYYCDGFYHSALTSGLRGLLALGAAGVGCLIGDAAPSLAWTTRGAALCEAAEDWNTEPFWQA